MQITRADDRENLVVVDLRMMEVGEREVGEERGDREGLFLRFTLKLTKNDITDVGSIADLVLVFLVHLVHWYPLVPDCT